MVCPKCQSPIEEDIVFCGTCGTQVSPLYARGATIVDATEAMQSRPAQPGDYARSSQSPQQDGGQYATLPYGNVPSSPVPVATPQYQYGQLPPSAPTVFTPSPSPIPPVSMPPSPIPLQSSQQPMTAPPVPSPNKGSSGWNTKKVVFVGFLVLILVAVVSAGTVVLLNKGGRSTASTGSAPAVVKPHALVSFLDGQGNSTALSINAVGLSAPTGENLYDAWLVNDGINEQATALGTLALQSDKTFQLDFNGNANLFSLGNHVEVTQEQGATKVPLGNVVLSGSFPPLAFVHIRHVLSSFPTTPNHVGLVVGMRDQMRLLSAQSELLRGTVSNGNQSAIRCAAQNMLDLIEGNNGPDMQVVPSFCAQWNIVPVGDGFGLLGDNSGYVSDVETHASLAATQQDSTPDIKLHARHVIVSSENVKGWLMTVQQDVHGLLANPSDTSKVQEILALTDHALNGVALNGSEAVLPVPGGGGTLTAYSHAQLMASLQMRP